MRLATRFLIGSTLGICATLLTPDAALSQRETRPAAASQAFLASECHRGCSVDSLTIDIDRGRKASPGAVTVTMLMIDTVALARRGAPPAPKERPVPLWVSCDSAACAAAIPSGKVSDKRLDDARVVRRTSLAWVAPAPLLLAMLKAKSITLHADDRAHVLGADAVQATRALLEAVKSAIPTAPYSPRAQLYITTFAAFGVPGDSSLAEDVGTATESLMMPATNTAPPTRVATLQHTGTGPGALPLLVQDDATGAAPIFGVGESVMIALPAARSGRRGTVAAKVLARQRVEAFRDTCQSMKVWTYLVALSPADLAASQRGRVPSPRTGEVIDRWNGVAVREAIAPKQAAAEARVMAASRTAVAQFARERASSGVRERDVQVLAALPRNGGFVTNFGIIAREGAGWRFPTLTLRSLTCPLP